MTEPAPNTASGSQAKEVISNASAYMFSRLCIEARPPGTLTNPDLSCLYDEMFRANLANGISAKVLRCGLFIFDFSGWPEARGLSSNHSFDKKAAATLNRIAVLNAHLMALYSASATIDKFALDKMLNTPGDIITMTSLDDPSQSMSFGSSPGMRQLPPNVPKNYRNTYSPQLLQQLQTEYSFYYSGIHVVTKAALVESFAILDRILTHPTERILDLINILAHACKSFDDHAYSLCLVTAWSIMERLVNDLWKSYIDSNKHRTIGADQVEFIDGGRKKRLMDGRSFTAAIMIEILSLSSTIPLDLYKDISSIRKARNDWMHELVLVSRETAALSITATCKLLGIVAGIELRIPLISKLH